MFNKKFKIMSRGKNLREPVVDIKEKKQEKIQKKLEAKMMKKRKKR